MVEMNSASDRPIPDSAGGGQPSPQSWWDRPKIWVTIGIILLLGFGFISSRLVPEALERSDASKEALWAIISVTSNTTEQVWSLSRASADLETRMGALG